MKLRARTTLQLERSIRSWSASNDGICKLCDRNQEENIIHFLFECTALQQIRAKEYTSLENNLISNNLNVLWETFIANNNDVKLYMMLGNLFELDENLGFIFDQSCKRLLNNLWEERKRIINNT